MYVCMYYVLCMYVMMYMTLHVHTKVHTYIHKYEDIFIIYIIHSYTLHTYIRTYYPGTYLHTCMYVRYECMYDVVYMYVYVMYTCTCTPVHTINHTYYIHVLHLNTPPHLSLSLVPSSLFIHTILLPSTLTASGRTLTTHNFYQSTVLNKFQLVCQQLVSQSLQVTTKTS